MTANAMSAKAMRRIVDRVLRVEQVISDSNPSADEGKRKKVADHDFQRLGTTEFIEEAIVSGIHKHTLEAVQRNKDPLVREGEVEKVYAMVDAHQDNCLRNTCKYLLDSAIARLKQNKRVPESTRRELARIHQIEGSEAAAEFLFQIFSPEEVGEVLETAFPPMEFIEPGTGNRYAFDRTMLWELWKALWPPTRRRQFTFLRDKVSRWKGDTTSGDRAIITALSDLRSFWRAKNRHDYADMIKSAGSTAWINPEAEPCKPSRRASRKRRHR